MTPRIIQSMEFSRPEYWSGQPFPSPGDLPNPGIKPRSPALQADSLPGTTLRFSGFPCGSDHRESSCNAGDLGLIPGSGRYPGEGNGNPLQYSCLENPMDRGAWQATVHRVTESHLTEVTWHTHMIKINSESLGA